MDLNKVSQYRNSFIKPRDKSQSHVNHVMIMENNHQGE